MTCCTTALSLQQFEPKQINYRQALPKAIFEERNQPQAYQQVVNELTESLPSLTNRFRQLS